jgi:hypothetical protein
VILFQKNTGEAPVPLYAMNNCQEAFW